MIFFVLIRLASSCSNDDAVLGVFRKREEALDAKHKYIERMTHRTDSMDTKMYTSLMLNRNMIIRMCRGDTECSDRVYCLISHCEAFGQSCRSVRYVSSDMRKICLETKKQILKELRNAENFPSEWLYNELELGMLRFNRNTDHIVELE